MGVMPAPFTPEHAMLRQVARDFVETEINPNTEAWESAGIWILVMKDHVVVQGYR